ncbi:uncharacterized protein [Argopecten irradians]|uniref:uncharacterized protein isoform X2 n=1 Tax=Argopecten irradians TaxID=31199 RepID=UPI003720A851
MELATLVLYLAWTAITTNAESFRLHEQILKMTSTEICKNHTVLNDPWREIGSRRGDNCDSQIREGWYRLMTTEGHSSSLPTTCVKNHVCGCLVAMWLDIRGEDLPQPGHTVSGFVCGSHPVLDIWQCCVVKETAFVHNCGNFFVYWLRPTDRCSVGYCGEGPQSDISPYTVKTGELATEKSDIPLRPIAGDSTANGVLLDLRQIRDVSTLDDMACPESHTRCPNGECVASSYLCSSEQFSSLPQPTTTYATRTPITFYFSVLRDRTRPPVSLTSGQPVVAAQTHLGGNNEDGPDSRSLSKETDTKREMLEGNVMPTDTHATTSLVGKSPIHSSVLLVNYSSVGASLPTAFPESLNSDQMSKTPPVFPTGGQMPFATKDYVSDYVTVSTTTKWMAEYITRTSADAYILPTASIDKADDNSNTNIYIGLDPKNPESPRNVLASTSRQYTTSCSTCLEPSLVATGDMANTYSLSVTTSMHLESQRDIPSHSTISQPIQSVASTSSSSQIILQSVSNIGQPMATSTIHNMISTSSSLLALPTLRVEQSVSSLQIRPSSASASFFTINSTRLQTPLLNQTTTSTDLPQSIDSLPQSTRPELLPSATHNVLPSKMATVTFPSSDTTGESCTKCIQIVFNLYEAIEDKQGEQNFRASVKTAFARMLTRFYGRRFRRDIRDSHRNSTHFLSSDVYIRNTSSMGNIVVLLLEVKHPLGGFVQSRYLEYLLQRREVRLSLGQDLRFYGATLTEFSVPESGATDTIRPKDVTGRTSIFAQHFGLFLAVIILSSFVAFTGVVAVVYLRNKARTGMWYCPSGIRYAKQLERSLLTKTENRHVSHMTNPIPDVDILRGEEPMTETSGEGSSSSRASLTGGSRSSKGSYPGVDTWVVPLGEGMSDGLADKEYDTRL